MHEFPPDHRDRDHRDHGDHETKPHIEEPDPLLKRLEEGDAGREPDRGEVKRDPPLTEHQVRGIRHIGDEVNPGAVVAEKDRRDERPAREPEHHRGRHPGDRDREVPEDDTEENADKKRDHVRAVKGLRLIPHEVRETGERILRPHAVETVPHLKLEAVIGEELDAGPGDPRDIDAIKMREVQFLNPDPIHRGAGDADRLRHEGRMLRREVDRFILFAEKGDHGKLRVFIGDDPQLVAEMHLAVRGG